MNSNAITINMIGEMDVNRLPEFEEEAKKVLQKPEISQVILNMERMSFMDSKTIGYIAYLYTTLKRTNRKLIISKPNENIIDILTLVGLNQIIPISS